MAQRIAAAGSLIVFVVCLLSGIAAENPFSTVVLRALIALVGSLVIGSIVGAMAQRMLDENLRTDPKNSKNDEANLPPDGR